MTHILRIVPRGLPAAGWDDEDECDLDGPRDLVLLTATEHGEREMERKAFATGTEASRYMLTVIRPRRPDPSTANEATR